ncbi:MAG: AAA family ATPase [Patescibacteria group bacterium]|nr:AAA family ATPase [Patescibacteria group bacterium]
MFLHKLIISGFKSFAHRTSLSFDRGITAIVGPNGSGKSNIVDAIRWALGEQSKKSLRGKKGDDIIFAGSRTKTPLGLAQVALTLENTTQKIPVNSGKEEGVNFSEITIKRKFYRNGEGEYLLNNSSVRLKDIEELLAQNNISQKGYIISQGMIDRVVVLSPQEKRELLEEVSGIKPLELKRIETQKKLETTRDNLVRVRALVAEIEPHLKRLAKQAREARNKEKITQKLQKLQKIWYTKIRQNQEKARQKIGKERAEIEGIIKNLETQIQNLQKMVSIMEVKQKKDQENWHLCYQNQVKLGRQKSALAEELATLRGTLVAEKLRPREQQQEINRARLEIQRIDAEIISSQKQNALLQNNLEKTQKEIEKLEKEGKKIEAEGVARPNPTTLQTALENLQNKQNSFLDNFKHGTDIASLKSQAQEILRLIQRLANWLKTAATLPEEQSGKRKLEMLMEDKGRKEEQAHSLFLKSRTEEEKILFLNFQKKSWEGKINLGHKQKGGESPADAQNIAKLQQKITLLSKEMQKKEGEERILEEKIAQLLKLDTARKNKLFALERESREKQDAMVKLGQEKARVELEEAKLNLEKQELTREIEKELGDKWGRIDITSKKESPPNLDYELQINKLKKKMLSAGSIDPEIITEYEQTRSRYDFLNQQAEDLEKASSGLDKLIHRLSRIIQKRFSIAFKTINLAFKKYFRMIFGRGGKASLKADPEGGIIIEACPPGKKLKSLSVLSGGEKALAGLSLIFGIIELARPPFCILDEVDAALDETNSHRFARILKILARGTQFICVTHNRATMKAAKMLYGVTMNEEGVSRLLSMKLEK